MLRRRVYVTFGVAVLVAGAMVGSAGANENAAAEGVPTFNADVAPILYENCAGCHRDGQVAPMSLTSYAEARPWARAIKTKVVSREMPPWFPDPRYGQFKDVPTLSQTEIDTIVAWADSGAPQGAGPSPEAPMFVDEWQHDRPPDWVLEMPLELDIPAQGELEYVKLWVDNPFPEGKFFEAHQMRPDNTNVVHHAAIYARSLPPGTKLGEKQVVPGGQLIRQPVPLDANETEAARLARGQTVASGNNNNDEIMVLYVPNQGFHKYPEGSGFRIEGHQYFVWDMHYTLTGRDETDRSVTGFWFPKEEPTHHVTMKSSGGEASLVEGIELRGNGRRPDKPVIPANDGDFAVTSIWAVTDDVTIYGMSPHMHFRGKDMSSVITYPDGTEATVLSVPNYDFNWQLVYDFVEPLKVPAGSTVKTVAHYDNSVKNRYNPSPDRDVYWSEQSWDEMLINWTKYSVDKEDLSLENKPPTQD